MRARATGTDNMGVLVGGLIEGSLGSRARLVAAMADSQDEVRAGARGMPLLCSRILQNGPAN